jgi:hypothetical protein
MSVFDFQIITDCKDDAITNKIIDRLQDITEYQFFYFEGSKVIHLFEVPWYGMPTDMKLLSSEFKDVLFVVYGSDNKDLFVFYFEDGKATDLIRPATIYPQFEESMLK